MSRMVDEDLKRFFRQLDELRNRVLAGNLDPVAIRPGLQSLIEGKTGRMTITNGLIHGRFTSPEVQLGNVRRWNAERGWGFIEADFALLGEPPAWPMDNPLTAVVLIPFLDSVPLTFEELWAVAASQQPDCWRWHELKSDPPHLRLLEGQTHTPRLRWVVLDLGANRGAIPAEVRGKTSLHAEVLAAAAHFPEWVRQMDGDEVPYIWLAGYQVNVPGGGPWRNVPYLHWSRHDRTVYLGAHWDGHQDLRSAVPVRRGSRNT